MRLSWLRPAGTGSAGSASATAQRAGDVPATAGASGSPETSGSPDPPDGDGTQNAKDAKDAKGSADLEVTVVPGIGRYHLPGCILIRFLGAEDLNVMTKSAAAAAGCVPCKACRPE